METLREFLIKTWGETVLDNPKLLAEGVDEDYDEEISRKFMHEVWSQKSWLVVAGESAVVSAPSTIVVFRADEITDEMLEQGDWEEVMDSPEPETGKTMKELAELVKERESDLAYGSETALLGEFVHRYATTDTCIEERGNEHVADEEYQSWANAYDRMEELEAAGEDYEITDLFDLPAGYTSRKSPMKM